MKFTKQFMQDVVWDNNEETKVIEDKIIHHNRWAVVHEVVFEYQDKFYKSYYRVGATEYQDESPYEYDDDEIECEEVKPVEKTVIVYEEINKNKEM